MSSVFTKIVSGEIPCYKVAETEDYFAFLDIFPLRKGHVLVIPKKETDDFFQLEDAELSGIMLFAKKVSQRIKMEFPCTKVGMAVVGIEVPHAHIHLIPIDSVADMDFKQEKLKLSSDELTSIADRLAF